MIESITRTTFQGLIISLTLAICGGAQAANQGFPMYQDADDVVGHCRYNGKPYDQRSILTVINQNRGGAKKKSGYLRLLRYYGANAEIREKMLLLTEYPSDVKGVAFLRWEYEPSSEIPVDQWLYMPSRQVLRRVSSRNDNDRFLGSVLTLGDIKTRSVDMDKHNIIATKPYRDGFIYTVESIPKRSGEMYSKRVKQFKQNLRARRCVLENVVYYDLRNKVLKKQYLTWRHINGIPVWKHVEIDNVQSKERSTFRVDKVEMNVGIEDSVFSKRTMRRGLK